VVPIGIVGTGAVAQALGRALTAAGERVVAVASRTPANARRAASFIGPQVEAVDCLALPRLTSRIIIATADAGIAPTSDCLASAGVSAGIVLHTCGGCGLAPLSAVRDRGAAGGMFHPLQTLPTPERGVEALPGIFYGVAGDPDAVTWARELATALGGHALVIPPERLTLYHAGAVLASNGLAAIVDVAVQLMSDAGVPPIDALRALSPLTRRSLDNVLTMGPEAALTGPISRGDVQTISRHVAALSSAPAVASEMYAAASRALIEISRRRGLADEKLIGLAAALK
jgi:predicted short-subunit dehydrogenase-like oxidoreductase (DUF2520 family)